jgi:hypothetical protein
MRHVDLWFISSGRYAPLGRAMQRTVVSATADRQSASANNRAPVACASLRRNCPGTIANKQTDAVDRM